MKHLHGSDEVYSPCKALFSSIQRVNIFPVEKYLIKHTALNLFALISFTQNDICQGEMINNKHKLRGRKMSA